MSDGHPEIKYAPPLACDATVSIECSGVRSFTPPVRVTRSLVMMQTCQPCGGEEVEAGRTDDGHDLNEAVSATILEYCPRRRRQTASAARRFPWLKPAESGTEQLEAWHMARRITCSKQEMLGVVAGTLLVATLKDGALNRQPTTSVETAKRLPFGNAHAQRMHRILAQYGLVKTRQDPETRVYEFTVLGHPAWLEFAMIPQVQTLLMDLGHADESRRRYGPKALNAYLGLVSSLRNEYK